MDKVLPTPITVEGKWFCYYCEKKHRYTPFFKCEVCPCTVCKMGCLNYFKQTNKGLICKTCIEIYKL